MGFQYTPKKLLSSPTEYLAQASAVQAVFPEHSLAISRHHASSGLGTHSSCINNPNSSSECLLFHRLVTRLPNF